MVDRQEWQKHLLVADNLVDSDPHTKPPAIRHSVLHYNILAELQRQLQWSALDAHT
jgi:hypothetical protein